jgi:hypothetical protein
VDHPSGRQVARGRRHRLARWQAVAEVTGPQLAAGRQDRRAAPAVDRAVHPAAAQQRGVGGVHDRVHLLLGDVALHCHDVHVTSLPHAEPVFETERLAIRDWQPEDVDRMLDMYSRADVVRFLGSVPTPMTSREMAAERVQRALRRNAEERAAGSPCGWWAVTTRSTGVVVGTVALVQVDGGQGLDVPLEVAWALHPDNQGRGYATRPPAAPSTEDTLPV